MKRRVLAIIIVAAVGYFWRVSASSEQASDEKLIRSARAASNEAIRKHDADAVASFFTEDYSLVSSTNLQLTGKDANHQSFAEHFDKRPDVTYVRTPRELGFYGPWGMAYELGTWEGGWSEGEGRVELGGTYLAKWQKLADRWLIRAEVFVPTHCEGSGYCDASP